MKVPFFSFDHVTEQLRPELEQAFRDFLDSKQYILGQRLAAFEGNFAAFCDTTHCIGVGSGLDALRLSLLALEIGKGDQVIIPAHTFIATAMAVSATGAEPILVDVMQDTYLIDPEQILPAITPKTKAIIPVHLYGQPCDMDKIMAIAEQHGLYVVEDFAQAQGATYRGQKAGSMGHINATSFYPTKNLGAYGDAGAVTTSDPALAQKVRLLRNYGSPQKYHHEILGHNSRMDELQAALLDIKLRHLDAWNAERRKIAAWYGALLPQAINRQHIIEEATSAYHLYVIRHPERDLLKDHLAANGIDTLIHYPIPTHLQPAYQHLELAVGRYPVAEAWASTVLSLPLFVGMTKKQIEYVCEMVREFAYA